MKYFCMPADFKNQTIDRYQALNAAYSDCHVMETYGNITVQNCFGSGRSISQLPKIGFDELNAYIRYSKDRGIEFNYTINASHMQNREFTSEGVREILAFLDQLQESGVRSLTVALPSLMELIQSSGYDFRLKASVICQITNANKAMHFKRMGAETIVVDESLNRNFETLKRIRDRFGDRVEIIVNSVCHQDCQYRMFHYNQISGDSINTSNEVSCGYYTSRCVLRIFGDISNYLKATWIRPEDLHYYTEMGIRYFKIQGRQTAVQGDPARAVECYFKERYDGDLKDLMFLFAPSSAAMRLSIQNARLDGFIRPFVEKPGFCRRDCESCRYCESFARKLLDYDDEQKKLSAVVGAAMEKDKFRTLVGAANLEKSPLDIP